jgi:hypothetical protein
MTILSKIKWVASILLVFAIVLTTNLIDKDNFNRLRYSINTIYEDRIVANDLIFELVLLLHEKGIAIVGTDSLFWKKKNDTINQDINNLISRYEQTKLTDREEISFKRLKRDLQKLTDTEKKYLRSDSGTEIKAKMTRLITDVKQHLSDLSKVQLEESKRQLGLSNDTMKDIDFFTQVEIIFLIVMAVLIQIIIMYTPNKSDSQPITNE